MSFITLDNVGVFTPMPLFKNLSLNINDGYHLGVVAKNGGGKTTLLDCLAGRNEPTEGRISHSRGLRLGYVEQNVPQDLFKMSFFDCLRLALPIDQQDDLWRVEILLASFEVPEEFHKRAISALSGGWQKVALIARAWASEPDALLLDEPTNHLDISKIQFLERWINDKAKRLPMVIVSHDRHFLDSCTTHTLFLRQETSMLYAHPYNVAKQLLLKDDAAVSDKVAQDIKEVRRLRRSAGELKNIGVNSHSDAAQKKSKQIASRAAEIEVTLKEAHIERTEQIRLSSRDSQSRVLLSLDDILVRTPCGKPLYQTGKLKVFQGDRIVLLGTNGAGKSQFIKLLRDRYVHPCCEIGVTYSPTVVLGYADQQMSQLPDNETPFGLITHRFLLGDQRSRTLLAGAGFSVDRQHSPLGEFSLGQKARLGMLVLRLIEPNFFLLDEPTNHVDIHGQEMLEAELLAQQATCIFVSHDRSFVRAVATRYFRIEKGRLLETDESV